MASAIRTGVCRFVSQHWPMAFSPVWRPFPTTRKHRGEARRKLGEAVAAGQVKTPPISAVNARAPKSIGVERIRTWTRYHDWSPGTQVGQRLVSRCRACEAVRIHIVRKDGSLLKLSGPEDGRCEVRTGWAKKKYARQGAV